MQRSNATINQATCRKSNSLLAQNRYMPASILELPGMQHRWRRLVAILRSTFCRASQLTPDIYACMCSSCTRLEHTAGREMLRDAVSVVQKIPVVKRIAYIVKGHAECQIWQSDFHISGRNAPGSLRSWPSKGCPFGRRGNLYVFSSTKPARATSVRQAVYKHKSEITSHMHN